MTLALVVTALSGVTGSWALEVLEQPRSLAEDRLGTLISQKGDADFLEARYLISGTGDAVACYVRGRLQNLEITFTRKPSDWRAGLTQVDIDPDKVQGDEQKDDNGDTFVVLTFSSGLRKGWRAVYREAPSDEWWPEALRRSRLDFIGPQMAD
ncbi:MAG: hypothetical protein KF884_04220 [Fimbriimonadaceae bacterium]|nr:hypothetical protein [Fimbriimonadaceae bacterium]QYK59296.1 MAG: hypothetical protein KF884_04220 [Fimbriimonadaceae bacterium]